MLGKNNKADYDKKYYIRVKDTEEYKERKRKYNARDYYNRREQRLLRERDKRNKLRLELMELLGGPQCRRCGFADFRALQFDHINGGGTKERREQINVWQVLSHIKNNLSEFQVLCANCNWIKRIEDKECAKAKKAMPEHLYIAKDTAKLEEYKQL